MKRKCLPLWPPRLPTPKYTRQSPSERERDRQQRESLVWSKSRSVSAYPTLVTQCGHQWASRRAVDAQSLFTFLTYAGFPCAYELYFYIDYVCNHAPGSYFFIYNPQSSFGRWFLTQTTTTKTSFFIYGLLTRNLFTRQYCTHRRIRKHLIYHPYHRRFNKPLNHIKTFLKPKRLSSPTPPRVFKTPLRESLRCRPRCRILYSTPVCRSTDIPYSFSSNRAGIG